MQLIKTLTLLFILNSFTTTLSAQDANNDATWQETVDFIKKYQKYLRPEIYMSIKNKHQVLKDNMQLTFSKNTMTITGTLETKEYNQYSDGDGYWKYVRTYKYVVPLNKLLIQKYKQNLLQTPGDYIKYSRTCKGRRPLSSSYESCFSEDNDTYDIAKLNIDYNDSVMEKRLSKAFSHLMYLSVTKQLEAQKASGDKF